MTTKKRQSFLVIVIVLVDDVERSGSSCSGRARASAQFCGRGVQNQALLP
jgi:hypothetical protein